MRQQTEAGDSDQEALQEARHGLRPTVAEKAEGRRKQLLTGDGNGAGEGADG